MSKKRMFVIQIVYFKPSGKYYTEEAVEGKFGDCGNEGVPTCAMYEVVEWVKQMQQESKLPGLQSGSRDGPIMVDCEDGFPHLIMPR